MLFGDGFEDIYQLEIKASTKSAGHLCERIDEQAFTGSIATEIQSRIESAYS